MFSKAKVNVLKKTYYLPIALVGIIFLLSALFNRQLNVFEQESQHLHTALEQQLQNTNEALHWLPQLDNSNDDVQLMVLLEQVVRLRQAMEKQIPRIEHHQRQRQASVGFIYQLLNNDASRSLLLIKELNTLWHGCYRRLITLENLNFESRRSANTIRQANLDCGQYRDIIKQQSMQLHSSNAIVEQNTVVVSYAKTGMYSMSISLYLLLPLFHLLKSRKRIALNCSALLPSVAVIETHFDTIVKTHNAKFLETVFSQASLEGKSFSELTLKILDRQQTEKLRLFMELLNSSYQKKNVLDNINPVSDLSVQSDSLENSNLSFKFRYANGRKEPEKMLIYIKTRKKTGKEVKKDAIDSLAPAMEENHNKVHKAMAVTSANIKSVNTKPVNTKPVNTPAERPLLVNDKVHQQNDGKLSLQKEARQALDDDIDDDIDKELIAEFIEDAKHTLMELVVEIRQLDSASTNVSKVLDRIYRKAHMFKGDAAMLEMAIVVNLLHQLEDELEVLKRKNTLIKADLLKLIDPIRKINNCFKRYTQHTNSNKPGKKRGAADAGTACFFSRLQDYINKLSENNAKSIHLVNNGFNYNLIPNDKQRDLLRLLIQLVRNSAIYGIEATQQRALLSKKPTGTIAMSLTRHAQGIIISVKDDGAGLNTKKLKQAAIASGKYSKAQVDKLSSRQINELVFQPGISTAQTVNEDAGRGIGLDLVQETVVAWGGKVSIKTRQGLFTEIAMLIPA